ncbi:MAG: nucleotide-diphospho-sugar transferase [Methylococcales bacterium]|nr:nucleotide-diphospho-sugar transferase [Methylococcales bacterium]
MKSAVLFLVFNRPDTTQQVFDAIRVAQPSKLYIAADGPRSGRADEMKRCLETRQIATNVDWPCEVKTLFRENNLGCRGAVSSAITWFFENEEMGIILEDDCCPSKDFFKYCDWALDTYKNEKMVWHINGNNFNQVLLDQPLLSFVALAQVWGWATWRDRWSKYIENPFYLAEAVQNEDVTWLISKIASIIKKNHISVLQKGLDTWDYQWQITVLRHSGLCLTCNSNLISNIGDGIDATHTFIDDRVRLPTQPIVGNLIYAKPLLDVRLTRWFEKKMGLCGFRSAVKIILKKVLKL